MKTSQLKQAKIAKLNDLLDQLDDCKDTLTAATKLESSTPDGNAEGLYNALVALEEVILSVEEELEQVTAPVTVKLGKPAHEDVGEEVTVAVLGCAK